MGPGLATVSLPEEIGGAVDFLGASRPALGQLLAHAPHPEVASAVSLAPFDPDTELLKVGGELAAVPRAVLAGGLHDLSGFDGGDCAVLSFGGEDHDVGVQLRGGDPISVLVLPEAAGRVNDLRGEQAFGRLEAGDSTAFPSHHSNLPLDA